MKNFLVFLFVISFFSFLPIVKAEDCPFGFVDDPAPGSCVRYIDTDSNNLCDLSELPLESNTQTSHKDEITYLSEDELKQKTVKEVADVYGISRSLYRTALSEYLKKDIKAADSLQILHDEDGLCAGVAANIALSIKNNESLEHLPEDELIKGEDLKKLKIYEAAELYGINQNEFANALSEKINAPVKLTEKIEYYHDYCNLEARDVKDVVNLMMAQGSQVGERPEEASATNKKTARYKIFPITVAVIIFYLITSLLVAQKKISLLTHRRIWNLVLLFSFLASAFLALFLIVRINWGVIIPLPLDMLYWHVETGTVMLLATLFHITWHIKYFTIIFKKLT